MSDRLQPLDVDGIPSASRPERTYRITRDVRGRVAHWPPCPAWTYRARCRHVDRAIALTECPLTTLVDDLAELATLARAVDASWRAGAQADRALLGWASRLRMRVEDALRASEERVVWETREARRAARTPDDLKAEREAIFARLARVGDAA